MRVKISPATWAVAVATLGGCDCYSVHPTEDDDGPGIVDPDAAADDAGRDDAGLDAGRASDSGSEDAGGEDAGVAMDAGPADAGAEDAGADEDGGIVIVGTDPLQLSEPLVHSRRPRVAIDDRANATVVWFDNARVFAKRWERGAWTENTDFGPGNTPMLDFNAFGDGVVVWEAWDSSATMARFFAPGAGWLLSEELAPGGTIPSVAIDGDGNAVALFSWNRHQPDRPLRTARYDFGVGWQDASILEEAEIWAVSPVVAANEAGDFVGAWVRDAQRNALVASRHDDGWEPAEYVANGGSPKVAVDRHGNTVLAWLAGDSVQAARQPAGEDYDEPEVVGLTGFAFGTDTMDMAASSDGIAFVVWAGPGEGDIGVVPVLASRGEPDDEWEEPVRIDTLDGEVREIAVAADEEGGAIAVWSQADGGTFHIWASRYLDRLGWLDPVRVDTIDDHAIELGLDVAPDGTAIVAWESFHEGPAKIWARILVP
jgi:hypothetical protein